MNDIAQAWYDLLFGVRRSIRYHRRRERFFDTFGKVASFLSIVLGSGAAVAILKDHTKTASVAALLVVCVSAANLLIGSSVAARKHADLARRFVDLEVRMNGSPESAEALRALTAVRLTIEADEPPVLRTLDVLCHNELVKAMGLEEGHTHKVTWYRRAFAQVFS